MTDIQIIVALITATSWFLTIDKVWHKRMEWYWNFAPIGIGFTSCLWIALIFG